MSERQHEYRVYRATALCPLFQRDVRARSERNREQKSPRGSSPRSPFISRSFSLLARRGSSSHFPRVLRTRNERLKRWCWPFRTRSRLVYRILPQFRGREKRTDFAPSAAPASCYCGELQEEAATGECVARNPRAKLAGGDERTSANRHKPLRGPQTKENKNQVTRPLPLALPPPYSCISSKQYSCRTVTRMPFGIIYISKFRKYYFIPPKLIGIPDVSTSFTCLSKNLTTR